MDKTCIIPGPVLAATNKMLNDYLTRLEAETAALAGLPAAKALAENHLKRVEIVTRLTAFYGTL